MMQKLTFQVINFQGISLSISYLFPTACCVATTFQYLVGNMVVSNTQAAASLSFLNSFVSFRFIGSSSFRISSKTRILFFFFFNFPTTTQAGKGNKKF